MKNFWSIVLLSLLLLLSVLPAAILADIESGTITVYLRGLVSGYPLEMDMNGSYTAQNNTMWFDSGTHLVAAIQGDHIFLYGNGFTLDAGTKVTFTRTSTDENTYLLLNSNPNKYAGDITLTIRDNQIRPIITLEIEEYVRGVVPYELGDSFPLEALKAQAIAARTYALAKAGAGINPDFDVDDTTNDQVFRGRSPYSPLSEQAVRETAGIIETKDGEPAHCYYSASNGGQTEDGQHVWPRAEKDYYNYMDVKDDPYDLENEASVVRRYVLKMEPMEGDLNPEITAVLREAAAAELSKTSPVISDQVRIDSIKAARLDEPMYPGSKIMTRVVFTFGLSTRAILETRTVTVPGPTPGPVTPDATPAPTAEPKTVTEYVYSDYEAMTEPVEVSVPFFGPLERGMGLSINGNDNEILTLYEIDSAFVFETRRYGHGVGLSQRGAEQMARAHGKTYEEILSFYYPGLKLETISYSAEKRQMENAFMAVFPSPRPSQTPRPTLMPVSQTELKEGWYIAEVTNIDEDSSLNLRTAPSLSAEIRMRLYKNQKLVVENEEEGGWVKVHTDAVEGYVKSEFLQAVEK